MTRRTARGQRIARQVAELAMAAPQVVLHRTSRMAAAGASPSARDQAEFVRMGSEKVVAFYQSWMGMWTAAFSAQWAMAQALSSAAWAWTAPAPGAAAAAASDAAARIVAAGLAPVHRKAVANARRLSRRKR